MVAPQPAGGGVLVSNPSGPDDSAPVLASPSIDVTERVRAPTPLPVRKRSRMPLVIGALVTVALGAVVVVVALGGSSSKDARTAAPSAAPRPEIAEPVAAEPVAAEPVAVEPVAVEPVAVEPVVTKPAAVAKPVAKRPKPQPKIKPKKPPEPEPKPKKEPAWNDDSPFMPVRTEKR